MSGRAQAAIAIWSSRAAGRRRDRPFAVYLGLMVALVAIAPVGRAVWLSATSVQGVAVLSAAVAPAVAVVVTVCLWAGALLLGRERGPALRPPFLAHALATSDIPVSEAFRGPLVRSGALVTVVCAGAAGLVGASLASAGLASPLASVSFAGVGLAVGVITTVACLAGQAVPRAAALIALVVAVLGVATVALPALQAFTPWGWVGLAYPVQEGGGAALIASGIVPAWAAPTALAALAIPLVTAVPWLLNRIDVTELVAHASRWSSATSHATGMDFAAAARAYQVHPRVGRRLRAVRAGSGLAGAGFARPGLVRSGLERPGLARTFLLRDAVGAIRTPGRFAAGVLGLALAVALVVLAAPPGSPGWMLGAAAGIVAFAASGPLTDGIRHAASVAADFPVYGIGDAHLLALHSLFPLAVALIVVAAVIGVIAAITGFGVVTGTVPGAAAAASALALVMLALANRTLSALKGPLPPVLLTPVPTAMGDPMAAVRLAWALDGLILAAAAGAASALLPTSPLLSAGVAVAIVAAGIHRWRRRR